MEAITQTLKAKLENFGLGARIDFSKFFFLNEDGSLNPEVPLSSWMEERKKEEGKTFEYRPMNGCLELQGFFVMGIIGLLESSGGQPTGNVFGFKN